MALDATCDHEIATSRTTSTAEGKAMAHLWIEDFPGEWAVLPLSAPRVQLAPRLALAPASAPTDVGAALLVRADTARDEWHVLAPHDEPVWINGLPLISGVRVLTDRDEIRLASGDAFFFSTETLARVTAMPALESVKSCPRCRAAIDPGTPAVCCPTCSLWHHQSEELPCWLYSEVCASCSQATALTAGFQWTPMDL
jgi:hypothetical protein